MCVGLAVHENGEREHRTREVGETRVYAYLVRPANLACILKTPSMRHLNLDH